MGRSWGFWGCWVWEQERWFGGGGGKGERERQAYNRKSRFTQIRGRVELRLYFRCVYFER